MANRTRRRYGRLPASPEKSRFDRKLFSLKDRLSPCWGTGPELFHIEEPRRLFLQIWTEQKEMSLLDDAVMKTLRVLEDAVYWICDVN